jgi:hypothetical protein
MRSGVTSVAILAIVLATTVGCRSMTGQSLGTNIDNQTTTMNVKARLVANRIQNLGWIDVDTNAGVVYLGGTAATQEQKETAGRIAASVDGVQRVVNNIQVREARPGKPTKAARQPAAAEGAQAQAAAPAASPGTAAFVGRHTMSGEVTDVDAGKGFITVRTPEREIELHFPPAVLQSINKGDRVTVELGISPHR